MHIEITNDQETRLADLNEFFVEILQAVIPAANPEDSPAAQNRFFSDPFQDDPKASNDWKEYVTPDLQHLFQSARGTVQSDLQRLAERPDGDTFDLTIPKAHIDAWLNVLNQARLAIAARESLSEAELDAVPPENIANRRDYIRFQIDFYAFLQSHLLETLR